MMRYFLPGWLCIGLVVFVALCITHFAGHRTWTTLGCWSVWPAVDSRDDRRLYLMDPTAACKIMTSEIERE